MEVLELTLENSESNKLEEIGNRFYEGVIDGITELYRNVVDKLDGIYDTVMAYGQKDGSGRGSGKQGGGRRNANKGPCKGSGPGYGKGGGRGGGQGRK